MVSLIEVPAPETLQRPEPEPIPAAPSKSRTLGAEPAGVFTPGPEWQTEDHRGRLLGPNVDMMRDFIDLCAGAEFDFPGVDQGYAKLDALVREL